MRDATHHREVKVRTNPWSPENFTINGYTPIYEDVEGLSASQVRAMQIQQHREEPLLLAGMRLLKSRFFPARQGGLIYRHSILLGSSNFVGMAIGPKRIGGELTGTLAIVFLVKEKASANRVLPCCLIPPRIQVSGKTYETDVREAGTATFAAQGGDEIAATNPLEIGTIGCVVERSGKQHVLTNYHVVGTFGANPIGTQCKTGGTPIGHVSAYVPVSDAVENYVDAATVEITQTTIMHTVKDVSPLAEDYITPTVLTAVRKSGAFTGLTYGRIENVHGFQPIPKNNKSYPFVEIIYISPSKNGPGYFMLGGDSGAVLFTPVMSNKYATKVYLPVGLCFARNDQGAGNYGLANHFNPIRQKLSITKVFFPSAMNMKWLILIICASAALSCSKTVGGRERTTVSQQAPSASLPPTAGKNNPEKLQKCNWRPDGRLVQRDNEYDFYEVRDREWIIIHRGSDEISSDAEMGAIFDPLELKKIRSSFNNASFPIAGFASTVSCDDYDRQNDRPQKAAFKCLYVELRRSAAELSQIRNCLDPLLAHRLGNCFGIRLFIHATD